MLEQDPRLHRHPLVRSSLYDTLDSETPSRVTTEIERVGKPVSRRPHSKNNKRASFARSKVCFLALPLFRPESKSSRHIW